MARSEATRSPSHDGTTLLPGFAALALAVRHLAPRQTSNTTQYYTVLEGDRIFSIAAKVDRGVCDIARANRMMDAEYLVPGFSLIIPDTISDPDNDTCLLMAQNATELSLQLQFSCGDGRRRSPGAILSHHYAACGVQGVGWRSIIQPLMSLLE
ncbi:LysM peptidoglycan-binding domain-containing protein [Aspergillus thermomutatus]|uniref:LysM domain-containing protein n=1 Tax=Aspergillus thermomutatus TaxID=41047 RepID=A0A397GR02_ASPTH|nr:uncharacterized protein CDV56_106879 [Aspergillus thermomutatus]RHZ53007.1 hypothetical protein CDV56_106879 [Aspergillus thermomutatus]